MYHNIEVGKKGEEIACDYLINKGHNILKRNYRTRFGEIDIISNYEGILVFTEVKTRTNLNYGYGYEAVGVRKQEKIHYTSMKFIQDHRVQENIQLRYDIIEVYMLNDIKINHIENAF